MKTAARIRETADGDLSIFFEHQLDPEVQQMAAFFAMDPADRAAFDAHWEKIRADDRITIRTILSGEEIAGYILVHSWFGDPELTYWIGRKHWGGGVATAALAAFLDEIAERPFFARVAADNIGSVRVLEKCSFDRVGADRGFANARGAETDELIFEKEA